ncbi:hypothetical protein D3C83_306360 [compost metagenome]
MIYHLPENPSPELRANLACLQDCVREDPSFARAARRAARVRTAMKNTGPFCAG